MKLSLIVSKDCDACVRAESVLRNLIHRANGLTLEIININNYKKENVVIVPALLINDKLYSYGEIDEDKIFDVLENHHEGKNKEL